MFPVETLLACVAACVVVVLSPGPDNILAIGRGLSQGRMAAALSSIGTGLFNMLNPKPGLFVLALKQRSVP